MKTLATAAAVASIAVLVACDGGGKVPPAMIETPVASQVRVIDADTVDIDGTRYRLFGIDAPEASQTCRAWGRTWDCGAAATEALISRAEGMSCESSGTDRYGRAIGVCSSGGQDLNAWLVANGWALAYRQFSEDYVSQEDQARSNRRGIHRGDFIEPCLSALRIHPLGVDCVRRMASESILHVVCVCINRIGTHRTMELALRRTDRRGRHICRDRFRQSECRGTRCTNVARRRCERVWTLAGLQRVRDGG